ncbi:MAG: peptide ABC transporter substrate-binding protein [Christensenellales bacterium]
MKRLVSLLLLTCMVLSFAPAVAQGATYRVLYSGEVTTLNYLATASTNEFAVAANVIDTLVEYDNLGQVKPSLAESWTTSEDGLTWTFTLRKGAQWVDGSGQAVAQVKAQDFVDAARYVLDAKNASATANILYSVVAGAQAYYDGTATPAEGATPAPKTEWDSVGVKAKDDYTLEYTLIQPTPYFLSMTTYVCFMPVNGEFLAAKGADFGLATGNDTLLYNGAYYISQLKPQEKRVYTRNALNWDAEHVYIEAIDMTYNKESTTLSPELYKRGEVDAADIDNAIARQWLQDPTLADLIRPIRQSGFYSHFWAFNFKPEFDAVYEPGNWKIAVNNENFRKSLFYGFDRVKASLPVEPDNPEAVMLYTITPHSFVDLNGSDYVTMGGLGAWTALGKDAFNEAKAKEFAALAKQELAQAGATFPVKVMTSYNPSSTSWAEQCVIVEQQLEGLLGADYIDIIIEPGPTTGFLSAVRRSGKYAYMDVNWGPDYADPETYTDPFRPSDQGGNYNFPDQITQVDENGKNLYEVYWAMVKEAKAITADIQARYLAFAEAEAYLIDHALVMPFGYANGGYTASRLDPFEGQYAPFGISIDRYKGQHLLDKPMNTEQYFDAQDAWEAARAALAE